MFPAEMKRWPNADSMFDPRRRRWANIKSALVKSVLNYIDVTKSSFQQNLFSIVWERHYVYFLQFYIISWPKMPKKYMHNPTWMISIAKNINSNSIWGTGTFASSSGVLEWLPVFHLAISNMAQRHAAFCERHVALHVRHVALHVRHVALLIFRQWSASSSYCYVIFNPHSPGHSGSLMSRLTPMTQYLITACVHSGNNWRCLHT